MIIGHAMKAGALKERNVVGVITGLMGAGKTSLLNRLFFLEPPGEYTSSGVCETSLRGLLRHVGNISVDHEWRLLSHEKIRELLAPLIKHGMGNNDMRKIANTIMELLGVSYFTETESSVTPLAEEAETEMQLVPLVKAAKGASIKLLELVHMIDTGGQPEAMEVMPSLIHNANLGIVVVNLEYGLDERPRITFHVNDMPYEKQCLSHYTGRDIILKLVSTLHAKKCANERFSILIVATHPDRVEGDLNARVAELNKELRSLLLPSFQKELIVYTMREITFVLNLKDPEKEDTLSKLSTIRSMIREAGDIIDVPSSFFIFEQELVARTKALRREILSLDECRQVGVSLSMSDELVQAALILFHHQNTFLYFRNILPNRVFINPQIPLDVVNGIVRYSYKVDLGHITGLPYDVGDKLDKGIITEAMLNCDEMRRDFFVEGFYEAKNAIELLRHTFTLAPLLSDSDENEGEYLMMCLKSSIPIDEHIPQSTDTVPLVMIFSSGCVPLGCFGSTISCLITKYGWRVVRKDGEPKCLAHNIASLRDCKLFVNVVLIDFSQYIELHIDSNLVFCNSPARVCSDIHTKVIGAMNSVLYESMCIKKEHIKVSSAVLCPCSKPPVKRFAAFVKFEDKYLLSCDSCSNTTIPDAKQCLWILPLFSLSVSQGLAILVTCDYEKNKDLGTLIGTREDAKAMKETFDHLKYNVHPLHNPTKRQIQALLKEVSDYLSTYEVGVEVQKEKVIIFAFSGHGTSVGTAEKVYANDGEMLDFKDEIMLPLTRNGNVFDIPKLFFMDACRGSIELQSDTASTMGDHVGVTAKSNFAKLVDFVAGNYRIDYATILHHVSFATTAGSAWMHKFAIALRDEGISLQDIAANVRKEVHENQGEHKQQCESVDRLNTGALYLKN